MRIPTLRFGSIERPANVRRVADMADVILDQEWAAKNQDLPLYYMYRDLWFEEDRELIMRHDLRYDITVIPPLVMGKELVKTKGHYHPECAPGITYPEIYEVVEGRAHFLLQKSEGDKIVDAVLVEAKKGDKLVIPPNYGHVTINPGPNTLKLANWVSRAFSSLYDEYVKKRGAAYYELVDGTLTPNPHYGDVPQLRRLKAVEIPELGIERARDLYSLIKNPERLAFLNRPQEFTWLFARALERTTS